MNVRKRRVKQGLFLIEVIKFRTETNISQTALDLDRLEMFSAVLYCNFVEVLTKLNGHPGWGDHYISTSTVKFYPAISFICYFSEL